MSIAYIGRTEIDKAFSIPTRPGEDSMSCLCQRCDGAGEVRVKIDPAGGDGFDNVDYVPCPDCKGSGEAKIVTTCSSPPFPSRHPDWVAHYDGDDETGPYGYGPTEAEAIKDLQDNYD